MTEEQKMWNLAYTTQRLHTTRTGVQIGLAYEHPPQPIRSQDEERIQRAFLSREPEARRWQDIVLVALFVIVLSAIPFI